MDSPSFTKTNFQIDMENVLQVKKLSSAAAIPNEALKHTSGVILCRYAFNTSRAIDTMNLVRMT